MFPRLVLIREETGFLAEEEEALHKPVFLFDVDLSAFEQYVVCIAELRSPAVSSPFDADLDV